MVDLEEASPVEATEPFSDTLEIRRRLASGTGSRNKSAPRLAPLLFLHSAVSGPESSSDAFVEGRRLLEYAVPGYDDDSGLKLSGIGGTGGTSASL